MITNNLINKLKSSKNILAFSAGIDSTALFFLLIDKNIDFDIAIVNYNTREQSKEEISFAKYLSSKYAKKIYIKEIINIQTNNFEATARDIRYKFFDDIVLKNNYDNIIFAHQLDDMLEWFFMQLSKGAGLKELIGMQEISSRNIKTKEQEIQKRYHIIRPLLQTTKDELLKYLHTNNIKYFIDESNIDTKYKRNHIRENYTKKFLSQYKDGIKKSFEFLHNDINLLPKIELIQQHKQYFIYKNNNKNIYKIIDFAFKQIGILLSKSQKDEIINTKDCVISNKIAIYIEKDIIHIAPYIKCVMDKKSKEKFRIKKIPPKIRGYLYINKTIEY
jgi:tRNA(Ile)-lysidine synthase